MMGGSILIFFKKKSSDACKAGCNLFCLKYVKLTATFFFEVLYRDLIFPNQKPLCLLRTLLVLEIPFSF
jgi:hypothetical protein